MFDYPTILATWETLPDAKLMFSREESGWAKRLDATHYCLGNVPLAPDLALYDIVTVRRGRGGVLQVKAIAQSYCTQKWTVRYPVGPTADDSQRRYTLLRQACQAAGAFLEGMYTGTAVCNAPDGVDVPAILQRAGVAEVTCALWVRKEALQPPEKG